MSEPLTKAAAWDIYAEALDLMITALTLAILVGGVGGVVAGLLFKPWAGFATAAVVAPVTVLLTVVDRRNHLGAFVRS
jgi:hypothetical protein